jgi:hypothetical protein
MLFGICHTPTDVSIRIWFGNLNITLTKNMEGNPRTKKNIVWQIRYYNEP